MIALSLHRQLSRRHILSLIRRWSGSQLIPDVTLSSSGSIRVLATVPPPLARSSHSCSLFRKTRIQELDILLFSGLTSTSSLRHLPTLALIYKVKLSMSALGSSQAPFPRATRPPFTPSLTRFPRPVNGEEKRRIQEHISSSCLFLVSLSSFICTAAGRMQNKNLTQYLSTTDQ
ncbi:hypothetical protein EDB83DRAFT_1091598 [Lactarius deliciosus]|nr:hypothetical protein EDB83DRAFT_1091598 [Lactarius deliciosus]